MPWLKQSIARLDAQRLTVAVLGSHSALEVCRGARLGGFRTLVIAQKGRERTYAEHYRARDGRGCVDDVMVLDHFADILQPAVQAELAERHAVFVPHRSFEVYLKSDYDAIEHAFRVPMFGNRYLLRIEERTEHPNQYDLLDAAAIRRPLIFATPEEIDRPVLVKALENARGFERAFFIARDADDYRREAALKINEGVFTKESLAESTIEEYVLGAPVNFNFFHSPLDGRLELLGTDARRQTNIGGLAMLPAELQAEVLGAIPLKYEEAGHFAVTVLESMLEDIFAAGERFVAAAAQLYPPGVIGPFALQSIVVPGPPKKEFVVVDVSPRVPGSPGIAATPYSAYLHGRPVSVGERIAMELRAALEQGALERILT